MVNRAVEILEDILSVPEELTPKSVEDAESDAPVKKMTDAAVTEELEEHKPHPNEAINVPESEPRVYFNDLNADSSNIVVFYWYHPAEYWDYLEHANWINLQIIERFNAEGIEFAFPTQTIYMADSKQ